MNTYNFKNYKDEKIKANYYHFGTEDGFLDRETGRLYFKKDYDQIKNFNELKRNNGFFESYIPFIVSNEKKIIFIEDNDIIGILKDKKYRFTEKEFYEYFISSIDEE